MGKEEGKLLSSLAQRMERERVRFLATWNGVKEDERRTRSGSHEMGPFSVVHSIQGHAGERKQALVRCKVERFESQRAIANGLLPGEKGTGHTQEAPAILYKAPHFNL